MEKLNNLLTTAKLNKNIHLQYGEDLEDGLLRKQIEELRVRLNPKVYRVKSKNRKEA